MVDLEDVRAAEAFHARHVGSAVESEHVERVVVREHRPQGARFLQVQLAVPIYVDEIEQKCCDLLHFWLVVDFFLV